MKLSELHLIDKGFEYQIMFNNAEDYIDKILAQKEVFLALPTGYSLCCEWVVLINFKFLME